MSVSIASPDKFSQGVHLLLTRWPALRRAVDEGWAGRESREKEQWLKQCVVDMYIHGDLRKDHGWDGLCDMLEDVMEHEFGVEIDDHSTEAVSKAIFQLYHACTSGDVGTVQWIWDRAEEKTALLPSFQPSSSDDDEQTDTSMEQEAMDNPSSTMHMDTSVHAHGPVSDADGWQTVKRKGRSKPST